MSAGLKDVAAAAGVSVKTASNVVNGYQFVSDDTRERVLAAIAELDYRPNLSARRLRTGRSNLIALSVTEIQAPYYAELASEVLDAAELRGWTVLIDKARSGEDSDRRPRLPSDLVDGAIASPPPSDAGEFRNVEAGHPLVLLGERLSAVDADHVAIDNIGAAAQATRHLIGMGRNEIAGIGGYAEPTDSLRLRGFLGAIAEADRRHDPELMVSVRRNHRKEGFDAMRSLLSRQPRPDAVFCFNDLLALGAIRAIRSAGLKVPNDVAVVGFDDIEDGRYSSPTLTTVSPDKAGIARAAVDLLAGRIEHPAPVRAREIFASHRLIVRESTSG